MHKYIHQQANAEYINYKEKNEKKQKERKMQVWITIYVTFQ